MLDPVLVMVWEAMAKPITADEFRQLVMGDAELAGFFNAHLDLYAQLYKTLKIADEYGKGDGLVRNWPCDSGSKTQDDELRAKAASRKVM